MTTHGRSTFINIRRRRYKVIERLSLPRRGRWKVWEPDPRPKGTLRTAIVLPDDAAARQLKTCLLRLPADRSGFPRLIAWDQVDGNLVLVIPHCVGIDLGKYLERVKNGKAQPPSIWETVRRIRGLAHSLGVLHRHCGVIHGDIKPANLVLPSDPGSLALIDFGSSWQLERTVYRGEGDGCDPSYAAPELYLNDSRASAVSDQFSVAVILYQMLTLELPYAALGGKAGHPRFRNEAPSTYQPPSALIKCREPIPKRILGELDELLSRALQLDPEHRFRSTQALIDELDSLWFHLQNAKFTRPEQCMSPLNWITKTLRIRSR